MSDAVETLKRCRAYHSYCEGEDGSCDGAIREVLAEVERLRAQVAKWERHEIRKASCCVENEAEIKRLRAAVKAKGLDVDYVIRAATRQAELESTNERLRASVTTQKVERVKLNAENERLRAALRRMAKDGCGLTTLPESKPCSDQWPDDDEQWCWSCQAVKALGGGDHAAPVG
jgi:hypothetical protein